MSHLKMVHRVLYPILIASQAVPIVAIAAPLVIILGYGLAPKLVIVGLIPLALRGVGYKAMSAEALLRRNLILYGVGGIVAPFLGIKLIDIIITAIHLA